MGFFGFPTELGPYYNKTSLCQTVGLHKILCRLINENEEFLVVSLKDIIETSVFEKTLVEGQIEDLLGVYQNKLSEVGCHMFGRDVRVQNTGEDNTSKQKRTSFIVGTGRTFLPPLL